MHFPLLCVSVHMINEDSVQTAGSIIMVQRFSLCLQSSGSGEVGELRNYSRSLENESLRVCM